MQYLFQLIHDWYPSQCCGQIDCKPILCENLQKIVDAGQFSRELIQASQDQFCHICINSVGKIMCAFMPLVS